MNYGEFFFFMEDYFYSILITSLVALGIYMAIYRKYFYSIFDPFFLAFSTMAFANATIFYLYQYDLIKAYYVISFLVTEISFIAGFFVFKPLTAYKNNLEVKPLPFKWYDSELFITVLFYWISIIHIILQLLTYAVVGLPILLDSRLATYSGGSGFGLVGRFTEITAAAGTVLVFYRVFYQKHTGFSKFYNYLYLFLLVCFLLVSGNKTNVVHLVYYLFLLQLCMSKTGGKQAAAVSKKISRTQAILFLSAIPAIFAVIYIQYINTVGNADNLDAGLILMARVFSFGDTYYMTLPNEIILKLNDHAPFIQLFKEPLTVFRLMSNPPDDLGIAITKYHVTGDANVTGPNARYNYFAMMYFGFFGQALYCFIVGVITSFIRNKLFKYVNGRMLNIVLYVLLCFFAVYIFQDLSYTIGRILNIVLVFPVLIILSAITYLILINWNKLVSKSGPIHAAIQPE